MDVIGWTKRFWLKVWNKIEDHIAKVVAGVIILAGVVLFAVFWEWATTKHLLEIYNWMLLLILSIFLFLFGSFLISMFREKGRLKNSHDIKNVIDNWFTTDINRRIPINRHGPYYFASIEKRLNIKRGSSKRYLPMVAFKHKYAFEMGGETFRLSKLTYENDPTPIFERYLNKLKDVKEIIIPCDEIDSELRWPEGAAKLFFLRKPPRRNDGLGIEIEDVGANRIRIILKE